MKLGIVGSEGAKFTAETEMKARAIIAKLIEEYHAHTVVSGACHLGGIDSWAVHEGHAIGAEILEFKPESRSWPSFKKRNIEIAENSDRIVCITVRDLPPGFREGGWERYCYHCKTDQHIKSGGCWTVKYAREKLGKPGEIIVI